MAITMPATQPKSAYQMILDWAPMRPLWQQDALRRIVAKGKLDSSDIDELVSLCLKGRGKAGIALDPIPLSDQDRLVRTTAGGTITLLSISDVRNANRLASDQILAFAPSGLTIVYGDNGVGKSGYARILKRACRARFTTEIMPNAFDVAAVKGATATISYADEGRAMPPIAWTDDRTPNHILSAVSVFDRESGAVHVRDHNEVAFRPFGLDIPDELANACSLIKEKLTAEQTRLNNARDPIFIHPTFSTGTPVGKILANLTADIDITPLKALAELSSEDNDRLQRLTEDLARDPLKAAAEQRALAKSLVRFASDLENVLKANADQELLALLGAAQDARTKRATAKLAATAIFSGAVLQGVGEEAWRHLWEAARRYSEQFAYTGQSFPMTAEDTACVLCQQPLGEDARNRFITFETFVTDDTEREAREAEAQLSLLHANILGKPIRIAAFPLRRQLVVSAPDVARAVLRCLAAARLRRAICLKTVVSGNTTSLPAEAPSPIQGLRELAAKVENYADELTAAANAAGRKRLEEERDALRDRKSLKVLLPKAEAEITRLSDLARISLCLTEVNTKAITALGNKIADEIITPRVRDRFQEEIQKLAATRVRVDIVRSGGKFGSPHYQVRLFANEQAKVHLVLSEGEQTCVALAVFLTELATASFASTLVFDDPVSSLDHRWRQKVAERLVDEAKSRQIIVFTHDLVFLNDLQTLAMRASVSHKEVFLNQSLVGTGIVNDGLPWVGQRLPQRLDALEKEARAAKALFDIQDDEGYAAAVAKFYNRLRSTWERALEDVAFCNVIHRHRDYINAKDLKKVAVLEAADVVAWEAGFKICCDITDAHDPSRGRNAASPPPADLIKHVQDLTSWVESLRERHKQIA